MKVLKAFLPNLTIALNIALIVVVYLDRRNPMMGFLVGAPFMVLVCSCALCSLMTAIVLYVDWRGSGRRKQEE